ncbi:related to peroxisomal short-chain alcohol dehydrogenase [Phialocephala subalpina]|uniref:Related to peroxisomal short-chain alcohol dehydrogenase n=1 Tax=Phialocephala subalpina TaxID=576137 RepID=A0A1L7WLP0_9HELO|nr:related to peroxisomal short-chain alcohol dehydrogenase [Phialocephala subalpina]
MDPDFVDQLFKGLLHTEVTKKVHRDVYPAISPSRPELSQAGRVILVPGAGTGVGHSIARSFVRASADTIIILGRRADVLAEAVTKLEQEAKITGTNTKIIARTCDVVNMAEVDAFWKDLAKQGIIVDVFVNNVAKFTDPKPILELGADEVWSQMEVNAKSPLYFVEKFYAQPSEKQKFLVNVTSAVIHMTENPQVAERPSYILSKMAGTMLFQLIALHVPPEKMQIVTMHLGVVYGDGWKAMGFPPDRFDSDELCGSFAVWCASEEAEFLHGRFAWSSWDVEELATGKIRERIESDPEYLRASIIGANCSI